MVLFLCRSQACLRSTRGRWALVLLLGQTLRAFLPILMGWFLLARMRRVVSLPLEAISSRFGRIHPLVEKQSFRVLVLPKQECWPCRSRCLLKCLLQIRCQVSGVSVLESLNHYLQLSVILVLSGKREISTLFFTDSISHCPDKLFFSELLAVLTSLVCRISSRIFKISSKRQVATAAKT